MTTLEHPAPDVNWYSLSAEDAARRENVDPEQGLSADDAARRLAEHGPNELHMLQRLLDTVTLSGGQWGTVIGLSLIAPAVVGLDKVVQLWRAAPTRP